MRILSEVNISRISWLKSGGLANQYIQPQSVDELVSIVKQFERDKVKYDLVGHTSNTYFLPSYNSDAIISTRLLNMYEEKDKTIVCECGVSVRHLARRMVEKGIKGFEGLIDLPGTVASSVYGNASCYGCSINELLVSYDFLQEDGNIVNLSFDSLKLSQRSSALKRGELKGVILRVYLKKEEGDKECLQLLSTLNTHRRCQTQPGPAHNLGSIFVTGKPTMLYYTVMIVSKIILYFSHEKDPLVLIQKRVAIVLSLLRNEDLLPYVSYGLNRYIWKDDMAHILFERYTKLYRRLHKNSEFEIEIKGR